MIRSRRMLLTDETANAEFLRLEKQKGQCCCSVDRIVRTGECGRGGQGGRQEPDCIGLCKPE